ncbi:unnamed protein product [Durusdinium trenchii]|uniref:Uncharacterized protein n=1 Tax=Durusdinium trenchii TaxID=1381693 RepID=A0ABP0LCS3_9DINO
MRLKSVEAPKMTSPALRAARGRPGRAGTGGIGPAMGGGTIEDVPDAKVVCGGRTSTSRSGIPTRKTAIKGAERAVAAFTKELEELKGISDDSEPVEHSEQPNQDLQLSRWRAEVEAERAAQVSEAERKLQEEKAARLKEAEEKLDQAIAERLQEAEEKLRAEVHSRLDDAQRHAEAKVKMFMEDVCPKIESSWAEQMKGLALKARDARAAVLHLAQEAG